MRPNAKQSATRSRQDPVRVLVIGEVLRKGEGILTRAEFVHVGNAADAEKLLLSGRFDGVVLRYGPAVHSTIEDLNRRYPGMRFWVIVGSGGGENGQVVAGLSRLKREFATTVTLLREDQRPRGLPGDGPDAPSPIAVGSIVNGWRLVAHCGSGSFGSTYLAVCLLAPSVIRAIKFLHEVA